MLVIKHKRGDCIGCNACAEEAPAHFDMADDGLVRLRQLEKTVTTDNGCVIEYASAFDHEGEELASAEELCPTDIISIHRAGQSGY
jgi:ferredoxin